MIEWFLWLYFGGGLRIILGDALLVWEILLLAALALGFILSRIPRSGSSGHEG